MEDEKLVSMANQISRFFRSYPEPDAIKGIHDHIVAFWTPGMRRTLNDRIAADPAGIDTLVVQAVAPGARPPGQNPTSKETAGPGTLGELESDAG
jgi:formate dehydrogenase subunit delta